MNPSGPGPEQGKQNDGSCGFFTEEKLVDFAAGRVTELEKAELDEHLSVCLLCSGLLKEWTELLQETKSVLLPMEVPAAGHGIRTQETDGLAGAGSEKTWQAQADALAGGYSSRSVHIRLRRRLMAKAIARSFRMKLQNCRKPAAAGAVLLMAVLLLAGLFDRTGAEEAASAMERKVHQQMHIMQDRPGTEKFVVLPEHPYYGSGLVWLRRDSGEVLMVLEGLYSLAGRDYQVWLGEQEHLQSGGILSVNDRDGRSYYYGGGAAEAVRIVISMEPKGGSSRPTGPEAVRLNIGTGE